MAHPRKQAAAKSGSWGDELESPQPDADLQPLLGTSAPRPRRSGNRTSGLRCILNCCTITVLLAVFLICGLMLNVLMTEHSMIVNVPHGSGAGELVHGADQTNPLRVKLNESATHSHSVSYDGRAITIDDKRTFLIVGSIHYPRSTPSMWPQLFAKSKQAGINTIDTYVFWNLHEPEEGQYDFSTDYANLPLFLKLADDAGLKVILRIGPYVCAEWNYGGIPAWLLKKDGIVFRTFNEPWLGEMAKFVRKVVEEVRPYFASNGGPIILAQIENEYGNFEWRYGLDGHRYVQWAEDLALSLHVGVPWIMCVQPDSSEKVISTCNGFYCDNFIPFHKFTRPRQPSMFTELWSGWYQHYGRPRAIRPPEDLAFSTLRWIARGGTYVGYYMWHGGTNFGRWSGSFKTASYDYDAPLNEFGVESQPKFNHLAEMHAVLIEFVEALLADEPKYVKLGTFMSYQEAHVYSDEHGNTMAFLSNTDTKREASVEFEGQPFHLPPWSVTVVTRRSGEADFAVRYSTAKLSSVSQNLAWIQAHSTSNTSQIVKPSVAGYIAERIGIWNTSETVLSTSGPLEQIRLTWDQTDHLWYVANVTLSSDAPGELKIDGLEDQASVFLDGRLAARVQGSRLSDDGNRAESLGPFTIPLEPAGAESGVHSLAILATVIGMYNFDAFMETLQKGVKGRVWLDGQELQVWNHQAGLEGERKRFHDPRTDTEWSSGYPSDQDTALTWYKLSLPLADLPADGSSWYYAIDLSTMGSGQVWVNGHSIGRYWSVSSPAPSQFRKDQCLAAAKDCDYRGVFNGDKCLLECGEISQKWYHIPASWIHQEAQGATAQIVVWAEDGGDIDGVRIAVMSNPTYPPHAI
ncbi:uncharacterized protein BJ171DRAFT_524274 [Polychytrium aggregatum]|uniref:uncharacterized protein n=1 Tax=Polychytrium aggregatum TaxID=110093 RepID=UPI0022FEE2A6|nr:uncharacterized protein BJ171DRAFT_524274 [Polychytrium aggregatum]KAI9193696.1 hypothetical protein BJ171DRAFT_524274 [Polychytrium aggregatum]